MRACAGMTEKTYGNVIPAKTGIWRLVNASAIFAKQFPYSP
jgi:hypothetical protein